MKNAFFEDVRQAQPFAPFINPESRNLTYIPHYHTEIEIVRVMSGTTAVTKNNMPYLLSAGDIFIAFPYEVHDFTSGEESLLQVMKLYVPPSFRYESELCRIGPSDALYEEINKLITQIVDEYREKKEGYECAISMYSSALLTLLIRKGGLTPVSYDRKKQQKLNLLTAVYEYLELHYAENITLSDMAGALCYSRYWFAHLFRETAGMSFVSYLTVFRLNKAKALLCEEKKVTDVASLCGFNTLRSFNRSFQKYYHTTPKQCRANALPAERENG